MTLEEIKSKWNETDKILYNTPEVKFQSVEAAKTKTIANDRKGPFLNGIFIKESDL